MSESPETQDQAQAQEPGKTQETSQDQDQDQGQDQGQSQGQSQDQAQEQDSPVRAAIDTKGLKQEHIRSAQVGEGHRVAFDIDGLPEDIYVGDAISLVVFGQCSSGCSLAGDVITLTDQLTGDLLATAPFTGFEDGLSFTDGIILTMPLEAGEFQLHMHYEPSPLPPPDDGGPAFDNPHSARDLLLVLNVKKHHVTMSTWGLSAPVWVNESLEVCVGASCPGIPSLEGARIDIYNEKNELVTSGDLQPPGPVRPKLWWTGIKATAPEEAKLHRWEARFVGDNVIHLPHDSNAHKFSFVTRVRPERQFTVHVIDEKLGKALRSARVELKPEPEGKAQFATSGAEGRANIGCAKGLFKLKITAPSKKMYTTTVDLTAGDVELEVHMLPTSSEEEQIPPVYLQGQAPAEDADPAAHDVAENPSPVDAPVKDAAPEATPGDAAPAGQDQTDQADKAD